VRLGLKLVKEVFEQGANLPIVPFPEDATSIQDTPRLVLLLADTTAEWDRNGKIRQQIAEWTLRRGSSARLYPASLIWCLRKSGRDLTPSGRDVSVLHGFGARFFTRLVPAMKSAAFRRERAATIFAATIFGADSIVPRQSGHGRIS
jgi:hypothetical protein